MATISIPLTQNKFALIDDSDMEAVSSLTWCAAKYQGGHVYAISNQRNDSGKMVTVLMHRFLLNAPRGLFVDHINGDGLDNRRANLRLVTPQQNSWNSSRRHHGSSRFKGVGRKRTDTRFCWEARIAYNHERIVIGRFADEEEAAHAYDRFAKELHGEFARLNFPD